MENLPKLLEDITKTSIVRSTLVGWRGEQSISHKGIKTSPSSRRVLKTLRRKPKRKFGKTQRAQYLLAVSLGHCIHKHRFNKAFKHLLELVESGLQMCTGIVGFISPETWAAMDVFLASISSEDYEPMASALIQMGATNNDVNAVAFARDLGSFWNMLLFDSFKLTKKKHVSFLEGH